MRVPGVVLLLIGLVLSGCAGKGASPANGMSGSSSLAPAPQPVVDFDTGSITGTVTDDEAMPIRGVDVGVLNNQTRAITDEGGAFTLNQLAPGTYSLFAQALGFESAAKKVEVRAGEISYANFTLAPVALAREPYYVPIVRTAFINVDQTFFTFVAHDLLNQNTSAICGSCFFDLVVEKGPIVQYMTEHTYAQTNVPAYNDGVHLSVTAGTGYDNAEFCWRQQRDWSNTTIVPAVASTGKAHVAIQSSFAGISFQHRVDMWATLAYQQPLPDGYSALPPTNEKRQDPSVCIIT